MNDNKLGNTISRLRKEKGITQKDLAKELNISDKAISRWECGASHPTLEMMFQISRYFNISYNDLITARISDNNDDNDIVENIVKEFQDISKRKIKIIRFCLIFVIILLLILLIAFIFTNTYNRFKVYKIHSESDIIHPIYGTYVETNIRDTLYLGDIKLKNIELKEDELITIDLYIIEDNKEIILQNYTRLENIYLVGSQSYVSIDNLSKYFDNVYLRIKIIDSKNNVEEYDIKLEFVLDFTNNKVIYNDEYNIENLNFKIINYNETNIEEILLDNGFNVLNDNILSKNSDKLKIIYYIDTKIISYTFEKKGFNYRYNYRLNDNILEVMVFDENSTEIQDYIYDIKNNKMECRVGRCSDYNKVLETLEEKVLYLFKD